MPRNNPIPLIFACTISRPMAEARGHSSEENEYQPIESEPEYEQCGSDYSSDTGLRASLPDNCLSFCVRKHKFVCMVSCAVFGPFSLRELKKAWQTDWFQKCAASSTVLVHRPEQVQSHCTSSWRHHSLCFPDFSQNQVREFLCNQMFACQPLSVQLAPVSQKCFPLVPFLLALGWSGSVAFDVVLVRSCLWVVLHNQTNLCLTLQPPKIQANSNPSPDPIQKLVDPMSRAKQPLAFASHGVESSPPQLSLGPVFFATSGEFCKSYLFCGSSLHALLVCFSHYTEPVDGEVYLVSLILEKQCRFASSYTPTSLERHVICKSVVLALSGNSHALSCTLSELFVSCSLHPRSTSKCGVDHSLAFSSPFALCVRACASDSSTIFVVQLTDQEAVYDDVAEPLPPRISRLAVRPVTSPTNTGEHVPMVVLAGSPSGQRWLTVSSSLCVRNAKNKFKANSEQKQVSQSVYEAQNIFNRSSLVSFDWVKILDGSFCYCIDKSLIFTDPHYHISEKTVVTSVI